MIVAADRLGKYCVFGLSAKKHSLRFSVLYIAIILGAVYAVILKIKANRSDEGEEAVKAFAFGPFLVIGLVLASFFGTQLMDLYIDYLTVPQIPDYYIG